jgi:hypothetical protein
VVDVVTGVLFVVNEFDEEIVEDELVECSWCGLGARAWPLYRLSVEAKNNNSSNQKKEREKMINK